MRDAAPWSEEERLTSEYAMLGFYVSGHPLEKFTSRLKDMGVLSLDEVEGRPVDPLEVPLLARSYVGLLGVASYTAS